MAQGNGPEKPWSKKRWGGGATPCCPICGLGEHQVTFEEDPNGILAIDCTNVCGRFEMERDLADELMEIHEYSLDNPEDPHPDRGLIRYLSCQTRQAHEEAETEPIRRDNWRKLAEQHRDTPLDEKPKRLLCLLADRAGHYGVSAEFEDADRMLVDEPAYAAFLALLDDLKENRLITVVFEAHPEVPDLIPRMPIEYTVTVRGWQKYLGDSSQQLPAEQTGQPVTARDEEVSGSGQAPNLTNHERIDAYIEEVRDKTGKKITRTDIWKKVAGYKEGTEFYKFQRGDEKTNRAARKNFERILREKPHLKMTE